MVVQTKKDPIYAWKALRLTVRESITGLAQTMEPLIRSRPVRGKGVDLEDIVHRLLLVRLLTACPWDEAVLQCEYDMYMQHVKACLRVCCDCMGNLMCLGCPASCCAGRRDEVLQDQRQ